MAGRFPRRVTTVVTSPQGFGLEIRPSQGNRGQAVFTSAGTSADTFTAALQNTAPLYGLPWNADDLDNLEIGLTGDSTKRRVGIRFRAPVTDTLQSIALAIAYGTGYSAGTGGSVKCALQADDGTSNHFPSGTDITSVTVTTPNGTPDTESIVTWTFSSPPSVVQGTLYHLVFTQQDAAPTTNWVSFDGTYNNPATATTPAQPAFADTDWYVNRFDGPSPGWTAQPQVSASPVNLHFVSSGLDYGWSVDYTPVVAAVRNVGGANNAVRMKIVPSATITVVKASARLYRQSATSQPLTIYLKDGSGTVLASGTVAASSFPSGTAGTNPGIGFWASITFSPITLTAGSTYTLECWSTAETTFYQAYPLRTAETGNWSDAAKMGRFDDGHWEYTTNAGSTWSLESSDTGYKMQGYLTTQAAIALTFTSTGTSSDTFTANRKRDTTFMSTGTSTDTFAAARQRGASFTSTGTSTDTFGLNRLRDTTFTSTGTSSDTFGLNRLRDASFTSTGTSSDTFAANRWRDLTFTSTGVGTSTFSANRWRDASFTSTGTSSDTFTLARKRAITFTSTGTSTDTFTINRLRDASFTSAGVGTSTFSANRWRDLTFTSTGVGTSTFTAARRRGVSFSSAGVGTSTFGVTIKSHLIPATFTSTGVGTSTWTAAARRSAAFTSAGTSTDTFGLTRRRAAAFTSTGSSSDTFMLARWRAITFTSAGSSSDTFTAARRRAAVFASAGSSADAFILHTTLLAVFTSTGSSFDTVELGLIQRAAPMVITVLMQRDQQTGIDLQRDAQIAVN